MHDRTRRRIALMLFVLVCVVPTTVIVGWGVWRRMPGYAKDEARRLSLLLGMRVSLTAVRHPRPGETVYEGLELSSPETDRAVLRCEALRVGWTTGRDPESHSLRFLHTLTAAEPEIDAAQTHELWQLIDRVIARVPARATSRHFWPQTRSRSRQPLKMSRNSRTSVATWEAKAIQAGFGSVSVWTGLKCPNRQRSSWGGSASRERPRSVGNSIRAAGLYAVPYSGRASTG